MAKLTFKGYSIILRPLRGVEGLWQLEIDRGNFVTTRSVGVEMTLKEIEQYAFDQIDLLIKKATTRFDIKAFKDKHPELYESFLIGGESVELKTNYKRSK